MFDILGATLKSLGYSINTENPDEIQAALDRLLELKPYAELVETTAEDALPLFESGEIVIMIGWSEDILAGQDTVESLRYILPEEGPLLWGDHFVIPASSSRKYTAEVFLNFLLRPEISAQITNENYYAMANEASLELVDPEIRANTVVFPTENSWLTARCSYRLARKPLKCGRMRGGHFLMKPTKFGNTTHSGDHNSQSRGWKDDMTEDVVS